MTGQDIYWATLLGIAEMLRFGIVSTTDMYSNISEMAKAFAESGAKINLSHGVTNFTGQPYDELPSTKDANAAISAYHMAENGRIRIDLSIHAEYTSDEKTVRALAMDAASRGLRAHVHLSETKKEHEECKKRRGGMTPAQYLASCGLFDVPATAAHCVWIEDVDREILAQKGVTVASCPKSNLKLASGVFDARAAKLAGVAVAIGTDSVASNNNLNMIEEIRTFLLAQKGFSGDPTLISPGEALFAATRAGALSQGREDCGEIREGNRADLIVIDLSQPSMWPSHDIMNNVAYSASGSDVVLTMCDGNVLYRDGDFMTIDLERVYAEVEASRGRILSELT
jgi:5-methylthioadenosine/S-adenosylhomocysteine deaminase